MIPKQIISAGALLVTAAAAFVGYASIYTLDEAEQAVIVQLGAPVGDPVTTPGLHFKKPFIQEVRRFDKRVISWDGDPNQIPTRGEQFISVDTTARWRIVEPLIFMQRVQNERGATMRAAAIVRDQCFTDIIACPRLQEAEIRR